MSTWKLAARVTESYELCSQLGQVLFSYRLDTYKISVAFLSYQEGILHVYSLPQSSSCEMEKKTCTAIISGLVFYTNILLISTNKQQDFIHA